MTKLILMTLTTIFCSISSALYQQTQYENRASETWVKITVGMSQSAKADLLFVVDDSGSMSTHQAHLASQINNVTQSLAFFSDLNAAVISSSMNPSYPTTVSDGKFVGPVLNSLNPNFALELSKQIKVGTNGSHIEKFFDPIFVATSEPLISTTNSGFLRATADLMIILLTDTEDQSTTITGPDLYSHLKALKPNNAIHVLSLSIIDPKTCFGESELIQAERPLKDFVTLAQGQTIDLCSDFSQEIPKAISSIKENISQVTLSTFPNTSVDYSTLSVLADNTPLPLGDAVDGWFYDSKKSLILLGSNVVENKKITTLTITYKLTPI